MYAMKTALYEALDSQIQETEATFLIGVVSEQFTIVIFPFYEMEETTVKEKIKMTAMRIAAVADSLSEGFCIGAWVEKESETE